MDINLGAFAAEVTDESEDGEIVPRWKRGRSEDGETAGTGSGKGSSRGINKAFAKLSLTTSQVVTNLVQEVNTIKAVLSIFYLLPGSCKYIKLARGGRKAYDAATKGRRGHNKGPVDLMFAQIFAKYVQETPEMRENPVLDQVVKLTPKNFALAASRWMISVAKGDLEGSDKKEKVAELEELEDTKWKVEIIFSISPLGQQYRAIAEPLLTKMTVAAEDTRYDRQPRNPRQRQLLEEQQVCEKLLKKI